MTLPATRGDCPTERPCPHRRCRHHLWIEAATISARHGHAVALEEMAETCSLDVADRGPYTLDSIAQLLHCTRENVRQREANGLAHMRRKLGRVAVDILEHLRDRDALAAPVPTCGAPFVDEPTSEDP